jgi:hypothetical protein
VQLLRNSLNVVESVNANNDLAALEAALEVLYPLLYGLLLEVLYWG